MSSGTSIQEEDSRSGKPEDEPSAPEPDINRIDNYQLPTPPPRCNNESGDYSDAMSVDSHHSALRRRRHQRGGRKKKKRSERVQSVSEFEIPRSGQTQEQTQSDPLEDTNASDSEDYDAEEWQKAKTCRPSTSGKKRSPRETPKADTDIKVFNLERAESSGDSRPLGISVERPKSKEKAKKGTTKNREDSEDEDEISDKKKPISIRLDLNLELEIVLRAKIKGDITITFLWVCDYKLA
jgi:hypothetical protein